MARVRNPLLNGVSGRIGNLVFRTFNGKTFVSARPQRSNHEPTEKKLAHEFKFSFTQNFLKPLAVLFNQTYKSTSKGLAGIVQAFSDNFKELVSGEHPRLSINFQKLILSRGTVPLPKSILAASINPGHIDFIWTNDDEIKPTDKMFAAVYCENLKQWVFELDGPARKQCNFSLDVSKFKGHPVHSYIGFISQTGHAASDSYYAGMVNVR